MRATVFGNVTSVVMGMAVGGCGPGTLGGGDRRAPGDNVSASEGEGEGEGEGDCVPQADGSDITSHCDGNAIVDSCGNVVQVCAEGTNCGDSLVVIRAFCTPPAQEGEACSSEISTAKCAEGLACVETEGEVSFCFDKGAFGEPCVFESFDVPCEDGLRCDFGPEGICVADVDLFCEGTAVVDGDGIVVQQCEGDTPICGENRLSVLAACGKLGEVGEDCGPGNPYAFSCSVGLSCVVTFDSHGVATCFAPSDAGEPCFVDNNFAVPYAIPCAGGLVCSQNASACPAEFVVDDELCSARLCVAD